MSAKQDKLATTTDQIGWIPKSFSRLSMRMTQVCFVVLLAGCSASNAPPQFTVEHRDTIKQNLQKLGAKVTAETPEEVYLSLRKTHIAVRDLGGTIEGSFKTRNDIQDFGIVTEAVAKGFLANSEFQNFKK